MGYGQHTNATFFRYLRTSPSPRYSLSTTDLGHLSPSWSVDVSRISVSQSMSNPNGRTYDHTREQLKSNVSTLLEVHVALSPAWQFPSSAGLLWSAPSFCSDFVYFVETTIVLKFFGAHDLFLVGKNLCRAIFVKIQILWDRNLASVVQFLLRCVAKLGVKVISNNHLVWTTHTTE